MKNYEMLTRQELLETLSERDKTIEACQKKLSVLENESARYRDFLEDSVIMGCFETDLKGRFTYFNPLNYEVLGTDRVTFESDGPPFVSEEDRKRLFSAFKKAVSSTRPVVAEYRLRHKDGTVRIVETEVSQIYDKKQGHVGYRGVSRDVTERRRASVELLRYKDFLENIDDGCYELDLKGYNIFCNQATERILGYSREELAAINHKTYTLQEDKEEIRSIFNEILHTGRSAKPYLRQIVRKDGEIRTVLTSTSLIRDPQGHPAGFRGIIQDVTERRRLEENEQKLTERLHQAQKMEAIGTLAGGIAHDFNNLLMGIMGYTSLMLQDETLGVAYQDKLKAIEYFVQSGADLSRQLLGYARGGRYEMKALNLNDLIAKTASMFCRTKKEIQVHRNLLPDLWSVEADPGQIEQVLLNLFVNAWQAMPGGGSLYLSSNNVMPEADYVRAFDIQPGPFVRVSITDTGVGMDERVKDRIFEPFFTTKEMGQGTGIGLASVYGIIRGHKGLIAVYSEKGRGSTFNIYLPASEKAAEAIDNRPVPEALGGKETILLAEDESMIAEVTTAMLENLGYTVMVAGTGEEAARIYQDHQGQIDLVIMDMIMPGCGGGRAVDAISEINPSVKVLLSSGYSLNGMIKDVLDRGGIRAFIQKPFQLGELAAKIREILSRSS